MYERRIAELTAKLHGRLGPDGRAAKGFGKNVLAVRRELTRLVKLQQTTAHTATIAARTESPDPVTVDKPAPVVVPSPPNPTPAVVGAPIFRRSTKP